MQVNRLWEKMKTSLWMQIGFFVACMILIGVCYIIALDWMRSLATINRQLSDERFLAKEIETVLVEEKRVQISGWALKNQCKNIEIQLIMQPDDGSKSYLLDTVLEEDAQVNAYFSSSWDYGKVRFSAQIGSNKLKKDVCYELFLVLRYMTEDKNESVVNVKTEKYIYNNQKYSYNPNTFIEPQFQDDLMKKVVEQGEICLYDADATIYVYKYQNEFYWIAGKKFRFNEYERTYITYQMWTTMAQKLPTYRQEYEFENWDFYFEDREYELKENSEYRVAIRPIQKSFPVTFYYTTIYDLENAKPIWHSGFYPMYDLSEQEWSVK